MENGIKEADEKHSAVVGWQQKDLILTRLVP
jgi:hypothetical protein